MSKNGSQTPTRELLRVTAKLAGAGRPSPRRIGPPLSEQKLLLLQQTPLAVIEWGLDFRVSDWNPAAEKMFGYSRSEAIGSHASFIVPQAVRPHVERLWLDLLSQQGGARSTNENCTKDGRTIVCEWYNSPLIDAHGRVIGVASLVQDITERVRAEESLQIQKAYLEQLFESAPEAIAILDTGYQIARVNREFTRMFGYTPEEAAGRSLDIIVPPERVGEAQFVRDSVRSGRTLSVESVRRRKDRSLLDVSILGTPINVSGGQVAVYLIYRDITDSKRAQRALAESESKFRAVAETAASAIYIHDGSDFLYVNRATEQISGYSREELLAMDPYLIVHSDFREQMRERGRARQQGHAVPSRYEFKIVTKNGEARWLDFSANLIQFEGRAAILATAVDITDRKRAEQLQSALYRIADMAASAGDLKQLFAGIHGIVGELMYARNFYIAIYDPVSALLSFPYFVDEEDAPPPPRPLGKGITEYVLRSGEPLLASPERFQELADAGAVESIGAPSVDWLGVPMKIGDQTFGVLVVQSYSENVRYGAKEKEILTFVSQQVATAVEHKRQQDALRASEARYRSLVQSAVYGIYRSHAEDYFLDVNPALVAMLGYDSPGEVLGLNLNWDVYVDPEERRKLLEEYRDTDRVEGIEVRWKRKDGTPFVVRLSGRATFGHPVQIFEMIAEDVTERHALEAQLRQSQKMEAIGRLAGGVAHDFNNLLTVIKGYGELILDDLKDSDPMRAEVLEMQKAADRAVSLTRQLLAFGRRQMLAPRVLDLNQLIANVDKLLRRLLGEDVALVTVPDPQLGSVRADPGQIEQVLMNLAVNSRDAMPRGGTLTIGTSNINLDQDYTREHFTVRPGAYVLLAVSDTGQGMDAETCSRIFEPFFTTKEQGKGTGLGLSTVYGIVKQSGGYIWVCSEPGLGTTFKIYLPRLEEAADVLLPASDRHQIQRGTETVLLVEDEEGVRALVRQVLHRHGYAVLDAPNGGEALLNCERHPGNIDLLLTDVVLAQMSGRELAQRLLLLRPHMKVLYMSGYTDEAVVQHGVLQSGASFLQKPFTSEVLTRKLREVLDSRH